jgi:hypothetical protein
MFTKNGVAHRIAIGLEGGVYVCRRVLFGGVVWQIVGSEDR